MGKSQRSKGSWGQTAAKHILEDRDWTVDPITAGVSKEDMIATDTNGISWSVEVKNCVSITVAHRQQAMKQAKARKLFWMLMSKISGTRYWLIQRQGCTPVVWAEKVSDLL